MWRRIGWRTSGWMMNDDDGICMYVCICLIGHNHLTSCLYTYIQAARKKRGEIIKRAETYVKEYKKVRRWVGR